MDMHPIIPTSSPLQTVVSVQITPLPDLSTLLSYELAQSSIDMYTRDVQAYIDYADAYMENWLDAATLTNWRDLLIQKNDKSPNTINRMIAAVKRVVRELAERKSIDEMISIRFDRIRGVKVKANKQRLKRNARTRISRVDMRRLCESPDRLTLIGARDAALLSLLASSGVRASEAATLTLQHVGTRDGAYFVYVCGKTDTDYREAHLSQEAFNLIHEWIERRPLSSEHVFTSFSTRAIIPSSKPISETTVWSIVTRYAKQCGLDAIKPHDFRRYLGTQLAKVDLRKAQLALGHKSIEITARAYVLDELEPGLTDNIY